MLTSSLYPQEEPEGSCAKRDSRFLILKYRPTLPKNTIRTPVTFPPGQNVLAAKRVELLRELTPKVSLPARGGAPTRAGRRCAPGGRCCCQRSGVDLHARAMEPPRRDAVARTSSIRSKIASTYYHAARRALGRFVHARRSRAPPRRVPAKAVERRSRADRQHEHRCR